jgi:hypothetical protein
MSNCTNCGYAMVADDVFCASCGHAQPPAAPATVPAWARSAPVTAGGNGETALGRPPDAARSAGPTYQEPRPASTPPPSAPQPTVFQIAADTVGVPPAGGSDAARASESIEHRYMRQTRTACVFIAVMVGIWSALLTIGIIYTIVTANNVNNALNNGISNLGNSSCLSQGGTDPSC